MTTINDIQRVLIDHSDLGRFGFGTGPATPDADLLAQVATARRWFAESPVQTRILERRGSYAIKHLIENSAGIYISNGATIMAAVLEGFAPVRKRPGPNCRFRRTP